MSQSSVNKKNQRILTVIPTLKDDPFVIIMDLLHQTVKPCHIVVVTAFKSSRDQIFKKISDIKERFIDIFVVRPNMEEHVGVRVGKAINAALTKLDLTKYSHIIKIDADVRLPADYIEKCIKMDSDLIGLGPFMMIKIKPFIRVLNGYWPETPADDAYVHLKFMSRKLKVTKWPYGIEVRTGGKFGNWKYYYFRGVDDFRMGIEPFHEIRNIIHLIKSRDTLLPIFSLVGYMFALFKGEKFYDFAPIIFRETLTGFRKILTIIPRAFSG